MYAKRIIPCLDVKNGRVVKGVSFVDLRDAGDPVECAAAYDRQGADELVLLDITATHEGRSTMLDIVERVAKTVFIPFTVGGGIKTVDDLLKLSDILHENKFDYDKLGEWCDFIIHSHDADGYSIEVYDGYKE